MKPIFDSGKFEVPQIKISIYKNRRGRYKGIYLWCKANLGTCRIEPLFATDYNYNMISIDNMKVEVIDEDDKIGFSEIDQKNAILAALL